MVTEEDYKREILAKYEADKSQSLREILQPSPAKLKKWSIYLLDTLSTDDKRVYCRFYKLNDVTANALKSFDNDRLRPLTNFLKGKSELSDPFGIELLAVLVDFEDRPFSKFMTIKYKKTLQPEIAKEKITGGELFAIPTEKPSMDNAIISNAEENEFDIAEDEVSDENEDAGKLSSATEESSVVENQNYETGIIPQRFFTIQNKNYKRYRIIFVVIISMMFIFLAYENLNTSLKGSGCMMWKSDRYETVPCDMQVNAYAGEKIIPADKMLLKYQRKIEVVDTTTFFNPDGQARVFYAKNNKECEYFTYPGKHPQTNKKLKEITQYIIDRHIRHKK